MDIIIGAIIVAVAVVVLALVIHRHAPAIVAGLHKVGDGTLQVADKVDTLQQTGEAALQHAKDQVQHLTGQG